MNRILLTIGLLLPVTITCFAQDVLKATNGSVITVQNGAIFYVTGGIVLDNNSSFNNEGIVTIERTGSIAADLTDNSSVPYNYGAGKFVFTGPGIQNLKSLNQFERIDIENMGLNLLTDVRSNTWYLKTGKVNTGSNLAIATSSAASAVQADATNSSYKNSWINGNLRRFFTPGSVNNYQFPVGNAVTVNIAEMDNLTASPLTGITYVTTSFGVKPGTDAGLNAIETGTAYTSINNAGVWHIIPDASASAGKFDLKLFLNGFASLVDNSFGILLRPDLSSNAGDWIVPPGSILPASGIAGRTVAANYARRNNMGIFGQFSIGSTSHPLPLDLLSFKATKKDKTVVLQWTTANEINTSHFEIYRSGKSGPFQYLNKVSAAGYSSTNLSYSFTDLNPLNGVGYYQLKMVDKDNKFKLSNIVMVNIEEAISFNVYPNPVTGKMLYVNYSGGKINGIRLFTADGKQIDCNYNNQNNNLLSIDLPYSIAKGVYNLQILSDDGVKIARVIVQ